MGWITLRPERPYAGGILTLTVDEDFLSAFPKSLILTSDQGKSELPLKGREVQLNLVVPGRYTVSTGAYSQEFLVREQGEVPVYAELLLTAGVVLLALGGLIRWAEKRKVGSASLFGRS